MIMNDTIKTIERINYLDSILKIKNKHIETIDDDIELRTILHLGGVNQILTLKFGNDEFFNLRIATEWIKLNKFR